MSGDIFIYGKMKIFLDSLDITVSGKVATYVDSMVIPSGSLDSMISFHLFGGI